MIARLLRRWRPIVDLTPIVPLPTRFTPAALAEWDTGLMPAIPADALADWEVELLNRAASAGDCGHRWRGHTCNDEPGHHDDHSFADRNGRLRATWPAETSPGGERTTAQATTPDAEAAGGSSPPGDTTDLQHRIAVEALHHLARELARVGLPDVDWDQLPTPARAIYHRYADACALAGWRPPADFTGDLT